MGTNGFACRYHIEIGLERMQSYAPDEDVNCTTLFENTAPERLNMLPIRALLLIGEDSVF
jgi:hypothetical protein